jgi:CDP-diacylglycerol---serine O-phosphatidyltransferase
LHEDKLENDETKPEEGKKLSIYLLPNFLTAANLLCGFFAMTWIFRYQDDGDFEPIRMAIRFILAAFVFDFFDGLLARAVGHESRFGVEFDSLSDMVSFGVVPAFLVYRIVLQDFHRLGIFVAAGYVACSAIRLARFNVLSQRKSPDNGDEFVGFPIPTAAGLVVSMTLLMMWLAGGEKSLGPWRLVLPMLMIVIAGLMVSTIRYPAFKHVEWTVMRSALTFSLAVVVFILLFQHFQVTLAMLFLSYMLFGIVRHAIRRLHQNREAA